MADILGEFKFRIVREEDVYVAYLYDGGSSPTSLMGIVQSKNRLEIFEQIADCYLDALEIPVPWFKKPWFGLKQWWWRRRRN